MIITFGSQVIGGQDGNGGQSAPTVQAAFLGSTKVGISWNSITGATNYVLERSTNSDMSASSQIYSGSSLNFLDTGRSATTTYYYRVKPNNAGYSNIDSVTTLGNATTVWWRASVGVSDTGGLVDSVADQGNSGINFTGTTTTRPTLITSNGASFLRFNQSALTGSFTNWSNSASDYYALIVAKKNQSVPAVDTVGTGYNATAGTRLGFGSVLGRSPSNMPLYYNMTVVGGDPTQNAKSGSVPGMLHFLEYLWQEPIKKLKINGIYDPESGTNTSYTKATNSPSLAGFGGSAGSVTSNNIESDVAEIFLMKGTIPEASANKIRSYFESLYPQETHPNFTWATDHGYTQIVQEDETVVIQTTGGDPFDYAAFPRMAIDNNNRLHVIFSQGPDHNSSTTQVLKYMYSDDVGYNFSTPIIIADKSGFFSNPQSGTGHVNMGGSDDVIIPGGIIVLPSGRILIGMNKMRGSGLAQRERYFIYSDDNMLTLNAITGDGVAGLMTDDYVPGTGQVTGVSSPILIGSILYTVVYGRTASSGNREVSLYKSEDGGMTWVRVSVVYATSANDPEEPEIFDAGQGLIVCLIRSDIQKKILMRFGWPSDSYANFSTTDIVGPASWGSNGAALSPSGGMFCFGRDTLATPGRTTINYSSNKGQDFIQTALMNATNYGYLYGNPVWHPGVNRFVSIVAEQIATDGPTRILSARWHEA